LKKLPRRKRKITGKGKEKPLPRKGEFVKEGKKSLSLSGGETKNDVGERGGLKEKFFGLEREK